ncbi:hypothetical protein [Sandaracinus amylolyticus]|uniref:hypothetical protein n=1 Tax=Sandaracinus amylolyticus TaxID=927083 RepID=UPI001F3F3CC6|nr:hypothetical protein [Sandaracinus amylolyticus]UJR79248.1 Hypothetical protein I5071_12810 [Sandaracinus amylolyticus]
MTSRRNAWLVALALGVATLASAAPAARADHRIDQPFTGTRPFQLEFHGGLAWYGFGFAGGARFGIPILHNGFVPSIDNAVYINFGGDFYFVDDWGCYRNDPGDPCAGHEYRFAMGFPVALHWEFYFSDTWSAFAELGFQVYLPPSLFYRGYVDYGDHVGAWVIAAVGGSLHLGDVVSLTLRVGNPYISFGVTLNLG